MVKDWQTGRPTLSLFGSPYQRAGTTCCVMNDDQPPLQYINSYFVIASCLRTDLVCEHYKRWVADRNARGLCEHAKTFEHYYCILRVN